MLFERLFGRRARRDEQRRAEREAYAERLRTPRWDRVEQSLGRPVPALLRELYADHALVTSVDLVVENPDQADTGDVPWWISGFIPADEEALAPGLASIPDGAFAFARNEFGDPYYVALGERPDGDGPVYVHHHDGDDTELVAPSLRSWLAWPRASSADRRASRDRSR